MRLDFDDLSVIKEYEMSLAMEVFISAPDLLGVRVESIDDNVGLAQLKDLGD